MSPVIHRTGSIPRSPIPKLRGWLPANTRRKRIALKSLRGRSLGVWEQQLLMGTAHASLTPPVSPGSRTSHVLIHESPSQHRGGVMAPVRSGNSSGAGRCGLPRVRQGGLASARVLNQGRPGVCGRRSGRIRRVRLFVELWPPG